tara:strand:- start:887 stop:1657 length:771 start_codon:yes stop_codon:yes gene_type:complete
MLLDKVVIGSSVEALIYALKEDCFILYNRDRPHLFYRELQVPILGSSREPEAITKLLLTLSLLGRVIQFEEVESIRIIGHTLKVFANNEAYNYEFELCSIFDSTAIVHENAIKSPRQPMYHVIDDFELKNLGRSTKSIPPLYQEEQFVSSLHFYTSERVDGANFITDCVSDSYLSMPQLQSFDYSDSIIKFVVERYLRSVGVNGTVAGMNKNGTTKYRRPYVTHVKRLVFEEDRNIYQDTECVKFVDKTLLEIINE